MNFKNKTTVIFDFDGTLVDTPKFIKDLFYQLKDEMGFSDLDESDFSNFRDKTIKELARQAGFPIWRLPELVIRINQETTALLSQVSFNNGVESMLESLQKTDVRLGIMSSNSEENIQKFLKNRQADFFDFIYSGSSLFGKHKVLSGLLKDQDLTKKEVVYVGDEVRDIKACRKIGVDMIAVDWGMNSCKLLKKYNPDWVMSSPKEITGRFI